jgi:NADH-quinone oxidoreductase subunit L
MFATFGAVDFPDRSSTQAPASQHTALTHRPAAADRRVWQVRAVPAAVWLGDAMEGPTPVSALIHAATMVTAGVYLVVRSHPIFDAAPTAQLAVAIVGAITLIFGAIVGCAKDDIKKALAASTMSQIGYMMLAAGLGPVGYAFAIFHLHHPRLLQGRDVPRRRLGHARLNDQVDMRRFGDPRRT